MTGPTSPGLLTRSACAAVRAQWKADGRTVVFTNGCFDILHRGHVEYLEAARALGDALIVGLNSDASVRRLKGASRPVVPLEDRAAVIARIRSVDAVVMFDEDTPLELITDLVPDILVKGADWAVDAVVGREVVEAAGGTVRTIPVVPGRSTTSIIERIRSGKGISERNP